MELAERKEEDINLTLGTSPRESGLLAHRKRLDSADALTLSWENINYGVWIGKKENKAYKQILLNVNGSASSGELVAILGATGSGKTSFLNCLSNRIEKSKRANLTGEILLNGERVKPTYFAKQSAYVTQQDVLYPHLTVEETFMMSCMFHTPKETPHHVREEMVNGVIAELGLNKVRNTIVGDEMSRGVSGGEKKRVNIGVELLSDPAILFLDEPTSGLDAFQAQSVMQSLEDLASNGRLIFAVIHQPRSSIYAMFDKICLLSEGRIIFFGPASGDGSAIDHFGSLGFEVPNHYNPADFFLDVLSVDYRSHEAEVATKRRIHSMADSWDQIVNEQMEEEKKRREEKKSSSSKNAENEKESEDGDEGGWVSHRSWFDQFFMLTRRSFLEISRNKAANIIKFTFSIFFALVLGSVYSEINYSQKSIQDRIGLLFFVSINQFFNAFFGVLNTFPKEKPIVQRERASKSYSVSAYYLAKFFSELPLTVAPPAIFCCIIYYMANLNPDAGRFFVFMLITCIISVCSTGLGMIISSFAPNVEAASAIGPPIGVVMILFGGYYINIDSLPLGAQWVKYISIFYWGFQAYLINEFKGADFNCENVADDMSMTSNSTSNAVNCIENGNQVIHNLSYEPSDGYSTGVIGLTVFTVCFHLIAYILIRLNRLSVMKLGQETEEGYGEDATKKVPELADEEQPKTTI
jgi:ABC-type multidrug transport system ATPase subunit/ABC-type multidrug transport system permease subunit